MSDSDDNDWLDEIIAEELPKTTDPVLRQYHKARDALIAEEKRQRSGK